MSRADASTVVHSDATSRRKPVNAYVLQVIVAANHQSGKDTHIRGLRVLGPLELVYLCFSVSTAVDDVCVNRESDSLDEDHFQFKTDEFRMFQAIR